MVHRHSRRLWGLPPSRDLRAKQFKPIQHIGPREPLGSDECTVPVERELEIHPDCIGLLVAAHVAGVAADVCAHTRAGDCVRRTALSGS